MRATDTKLVFQYCDWIVLVDSLSLLTGILENSDDKATFSRLLVDLKLYDLTDIIYALWFQDEFGGD